MRNAAMAVVLLTLVSARAGGDELRSTSPSAAPRGFESESAFGQLFNRRPDRPRFRTSLGVPVGDPQHARLSFKPMKKGAVLSLSIDATSLLDR